MNYRYITLLFFEVLFLAISLSVTSYASQEHATKLPSQYLSSRYEVLDFWHEKLGIGDNAHTAAKYKILDHQNDSVSVITIDDNASSIDEVKQSKDFQDSSASKIHPQLVERFTKQADLLQSEASGQLSVINETKSSEQIVHVWLVDSDEREAAGSSSGYNVAVKHDENKKVSFRTKEDALAAIRAVENKAKQARAVTNSHFNNIVDKFIATEQVPAGKVVYRYRYAPAVVLLLTYSECNKLEKSTLVNYLFPEEQFKYEMDESASGVKGQSVWNLGINGEGVTIADIEPGRMTDSNPYLSARAYRINDDINSHPTAVGGIICSVHPNYKGISYGCSLLNANAASFYGTDLIAATEWAISQGASVLSMSLGLKQSNDGELQWSDIYFDYLVSNNHILFVESAGNSGDDSFEPNRVISSPGRGYNSLVVGSIDGKQTADWSDDTMSFFSSYVNPVTGTEKPEIVSYGSNISTTLTEAPWVGIIGSGTSFSAPMVAGIAGLIINQEPSLAEWPEIVKAKILVSGLAHNIEGDSTLSARDGAGAALATAAFADGTGQVLTPDSFDSNGYYDLDVNIPLLANDPIRIVLVYTHPPTSKNALPDPTSYLKSDLDLYLFNGTTNIAESRFGMQNPFEIIDFIPSESGIGHIKIGATSWHPDVQNIRVGVAWASLSTLGTGPDYEPPFDNFADAAVLPGWSGHITTTNLNAAIEVNEPVDTNNPGGSSVWWRWIAPANGQLNLDTSGSDFDTLLSVYTGDSLETLTPVVSDNNNMTNDYNSRITFKAISGETYYIAIDGNNGAQGNTTLNWQFGQPNNNFSDAAELSGNIAQAIGSDAYASRELNEPYHNGDVNGASVWWRWIAPTSGQTTINTFNSTILGTPVAVYKGNSLNNLIEVQYNDYEDYANAQAVFQAQSGTEYYIAVDAPTLAHIGDIVLNLNSQPNDNFINATNISSGPFVLLSSNVNATKESGEKLHAGKSGSASVWWRWTSPANGSLLLMMYGSSFDSLLAIYRGNSLSGLTTVTSNDDYYSGIYNWSLVEFNTVAGTTYYFAVDGKYGETGIIWLTGALTVSTSLPVNDNFANATVMSGQSGQVPGSNVNATKEHGEKSHAGNSGGASAWWRWTASSSRQVTIDTLDSDFDTLLAVYKGNSLSALTTVAYNDNADYSTYQSKLSFNATAGTTYYIAVDGYYSWLTGLETGEIVLRWK